MATQRILALSLLVAFTAAPAIAQWPTLSRVVRAKMSTDGGKPQLILMLKSYRMEKTDRPVTVTKTRSEARTRNILRDGKEIPITYHVSIPYTEQVNEIAKPAGLKPNTFDASDFQIYDLAGNVVSIEDASKRLEKLTPVFLMDYYRREFMPVPDLQRAVLNPDSLVFVTPDQVRNNPNGVRLLPGEARILRPAAIKKKK